MKSVCVKGIRIFQINTCVHVHKASVYLFGFPIMVQGSVTFPVRLVARALLGREDYFFTVWYRYFQDQAVSRCCQTLAKLVLLLHFPLPFILEHHLFSEVFRSLGNLWEVKTNKQKYTYCLNPIWLLPKVPPFWCVWLKFKLVTSNLEEKIRKNDATHWMN